jgi:hypothetical protein
MTHRTLCVIVLVAALCASVRPVVAQVGVLSWLFKAEKVAHVGGEISLAAKLGRTTASLTRAEVLTLAAGTTGVYLEIEGPQVVLQSLQGMAKSVSIATEDLTKSLSRILRDIGGDAPNSRVLMTRHTATSLGPALDDLIKANKAFVFDSDFGQVPLRLERLADGSPARFREIVPGLYVRLEGELSSDVISLLQAPLRTDRLRVVSIFHATDDADAIKRVAEVAGDRLSDVNKILRPDGSVSFRAFSKQTVVIVGHVEDGAFVAKAADGSIASKVSISALEKAARDADVSLLSAGCSSEVAGSSNGFIEGITDSGFAASLRAALSTDTYGKFLGAMGKESPFVVSDRGLSALADEHRLQMEVVNRYSKPINGGFRTVRIYQAFRGALEVYQIELLAVVGAVITSFLLMFKRNRSAFLNAYPLLPASMFHPNVYLTTRCIREFLFLVIGPFVSLAVACSLPLGGWKYRDRFNLFLWSALSRPAEFAFYLFAYCSYFLLWVSLLVAIASFFLAVSEVLRASAGESSFVLLIVCMGIAIGCFWYAQRKIPELIIDSLMAKDWPREVRLVGMLAAAIGIVIVGIVASLSIATVGWLLSA